MAIGDIVRLGFPDAIVTFGFASDEDVVGPSPEAPPDVLTRVHVADRPLRRIPRSEQDLPR